jgi:ribosomal protein S6--L-glutamate ligase
VAYALADLAAHFPAFQGRDAVVAKRDRGHLGLGVSLWPSLESLYSLASLQGLIYPLVVQPCLTDARDVRVVVLGDYVEAYERLNPHSFRKNLFQGGSSHSFTLTQAQQDFCRAVMGRGQFPYAILDLLLDPESGRPYLSEISFKGGLTGALLSQAEFRTRVAALEEGFCQSWENSSKTLP